METGRNIQRIARVLFWVILLIGVLIGIAAAVLLNVFLRRWYTGFRILCGIIVVLLSIALSFPLAWIAECLLSGYGEIVENTAAIRLSLAQGRVEAESYHEKERSQTLPVEPKPQPEPPVPQHRPEPKPAPAEPPKPAPMQNASVRCPNCGAEQAEGRKSCWNCGARLPEA